MSYNQAIRLNPNLAVAHISRGIAWERIKKYGNAISDYSKAITIDPQDAQALNAIARLYATCPDEKYRNGQKAIGFARKAYELNGAKNAHDSVTLAAAYAEEGDFEKAVEWQTKALAEAPEKDKAVFQAHLELYKSGKPFRDERK